MLNFLSFLAISSVSAKPAVGVAIAVYDSPGNETSNGEETGGISSTCLNALSPNLTQVQTCGLYVATTIASGFVNGTFPTSLPSAADLSTPSLDAFCSNGCYNALATLLETFLSPACVNQTSPWDEIGLTKYDLPAVVGVFRSAVCLKDGSQYCAETLFQLLSTNPNDPQSLQRAQGLICTNCAKLQGNLVTAGFGNFSETLQQIVQPKFTLLTETQMNCPNASTPTPTPNAAPSMTSSPLLAFVLMLLSL